MSKFWEVGGSSSSESESEDEEDKAPVVQQKAQKSEYAGNALEDSGDEEEGVRIVRSKVISCHTLHPPLPPPPPPMYTRSHSLQHVHVYCLAHSRSLGLLSVCAHS